MKHPLFCGYSRSY